MRVLTELLTPRAAQSDWILRVPATSSRASSMITFLGKRRWIGEKGKINVKKKNKRRKSQATAKWLNTPSQRQFQFPTSSNYFDSPLFYNFLVLYLRSAILNRRSITTAIKCGSALLPSSVLDEARTSVQHLLFFCFLLSFLFFWFSDFVFYCVFYLDCERPSPEDKGRVFGGTPIMRAMRNGTDV